MKAFVLDRYAKKGVLRRAEVPAPSLGDDEVLVEVHAAGVNPLDAKIRDGEFKLILPYKMPLILGHDVAGVVVRVGPRVRQFKPGDEVYARADDFHIGTFAELIAVKESSLAFKPRSLTMEEAASIPLVALTAWQALVEKAQVRKGQKVFIQAGSGGLGSIAIQLAKHLGATVATFAAEPARPYADRIAAVSGLRALHFLALHTPCAHKACGTSHAPATIPLQHHATSAPWPPPSPPKAPMSEPDSRAPALPVHP
eukprot:gene18981-38146_t